MIYTTMYIRIKKIYLGCYVSVGMSVPMQNGMKNGILQNGISVSLTYWYICNLNITIQQVRSIS